MGNCQGPPEPDKDDRTTARENFPRGSQAPPRTAHLRLVMNASSASPARSGALLAINLLFLMVWGFAGIGKVVSGYPAWFGDKFGKTLLATFPGLTLSYWSLAAAEILAFALAACALLGGEFLGRRAPTKLTWMLVWSLFVFLQLSFGLWLTSDFTGGAQMFAYFAGTLVSLHFVGGASAPATAPR